MEEIIQKLVNDKAEQDNLIDLDAYYKGVRDAIAAISDRPLTVIAPTIEWGEWGEWGLFDGTSTQWKVSKCGRYSICHDVEYSKYAAFIREPRTNIADDDIEENAIAACQAHAQAKVNKALEGCKVERYRDPQPLLDIIKQATTYCEFKIARVESGFSDERFIEIMGEKFTSTLKEWEKG